jgi:hypothetical protein
MEAASTSKMLVNFYQITRHYKPDENHLHTRCRENLKSYLENTKFMFHNHNAGQSKTQEWSKDPTCQDCDVEKYLEIYITEHNFYDNIEWIIKFFMV